MTTGIQGRWLDNETLQFDNVRLLVTSDPKNYGVPSTRERFLLLKGKEQLADYERIAATVSTRHILELGIWQGGSSVYLLKTFNPEKLVALDLSPRVTALEEYIDEHSLRDRVKLFWNVNQADTERVTQILLDQFPGRTLDLVIDDASHFLAETMSAFNTIFPFVRPGGLYVIEDWGWAHWNHDHWQRGGGAWKDKPAMTQLVFELIMLCASRSGVVSHVAIHPGMVVVNRGADPIDRDFEIARAYLSRGKQFLALGLPQRRRWAQYVARALARWQL